MATNQTLREGLYARVSSEQQAKENTIGSQLEALRQRITEDGLPCEEELCFIDNGYSGGTLVRPALERMRDLAAAGGLDRLYIHSPDRLARKYAYQVLLVDELRRCRRRVPVRQPSPRPGSSNTCLKVSLTAFSLPRILLSLGSAGAQLV